MFRNLNQADLEIIEKHKNSDDGNFILGTEEGYDFASKSHFQTTIEKLLRISPYESSALANSKIALFFNLKKNNLQETLKNIDAEDYVFGLESLPKCKRLSEVFNVLCATSLMSSIEENNNKLTPFEKKVYQVITLLQSESYNFAELQNILINLQIKSIDELTQISKEQKILISNKKFSDSIIGYTKVANIAEEFNFNSISDDSYGQNTPSFICLYETMLNSDIYNIESTDVLKQAQKLIAYDNCPTTTQSNIYNTANDNLIVSENQRNLLEKYIYFLENCSEDKKNLSELKTAYETNWPDECVDYFKSIKEFVEESIEKKDSTKMLNTENITIC